MDLDINALLLSLDAQGAVLGEQDNGEYLVIDTSRLPAATSTATVTIHVTG